MVIVIPEQSWPVLLPTFLYLGATLVSYTELHPNPETFLATAIPLFFLTAEDQGLKHAGRMLDRLAIAQLPWP